MATFGREWARDFRRLEIWQVSNDFAVGAYRLMESLPLAERNGLSPQIQRCAVSVPANIVEGTGWVAKSVFARLLNVVQRSLNRSKALIDLCAKFEFVAEPCSGEWSVRTRDSAVRIRNFRTRLTATQGL